MIRLVNLFVLMITIVTAFALYRVKYEVSGEARNVAQLRQQIDGEHDAIALLQAEWSHLNEPGRVQALARRHLDLGPVSVQQIVTVRELPHRSLELAPHTGHAGIDHETGATGSLR